jgi:hypothetical protein
LQDAVSNSFHRTLEVRGNKHPRFTGLDEIEQSPILLGRPICSAVLHSHQNTLISSPSLSSPFERDFSKVDIQSHGARADGVFGSVQLHSDLTRLHVGERQRAQPFVVLRRPRTNFFPAAVIAALFLRLQPQLYKPADAIISILV